MSNKSNLIEPVDQAAPGLGHNGGPAFDSDEGGFLWGAKAIGAYVNVEDPRKFYYMFERGLFGDAVIKTGRRTFLASKSRLRQRFSMLFSGKVE
jgi:hypothetical protein